MAGRGPREGRRAFFTRARALAALRFAGRVLVTLGRLAWGLLDLTRHLVLILCAAAFGWRFGSR